ncbi:hypothetical protein [Streptomyces sp. NPDC005760]|uniref:hypothetical protein n=1 Tax=Streptomyces sp. NPDC005760 TaxID=3156718 RepID=UPI0033CF4A1B
MIIPVRVPAGAPLHTEGGVRRLQPDHPLFSARCPACDNPLHDQPVTLVYVGAHPDSRKAAGWMTAAAVAVHAACAGITQT